MGSKGLNLKTEIQRAAQVIRNARALIVTSGAGMGVDSGLPDFRGAAGFWKAYPPLKKRGLQLQGMSNPEWFIKDPHFAWGFFGHRYNLYKRTEPHRGFKLLKQWADKKDCGYFIFTSNVDGHFQKVGFHPDKIVECHGSINFLQCINSYDNAQIWEVPEDTVFDVDDDTLTAKSTLPMGPPDHNNMLARPNIMMFGDRQWVPTRTDAQEKNFFSFQMSMMKEGGIPFAVVEIGAGHSVPTVRITSEDLVGRNKGTLIRINTKDIKVPKGHISLPMKGLEALEAIEEHL